MLLRDRACGVLRNKSRIGMWVVARPRNPRGPLLAGKQHRPEKEGRPGEGSSDGQAWMIRKIQGPATHHDLPEAVYCRLGLLPEQSRSGGNIHSC